MLLPSHYMANLRGYEWLMGADRALDPAKLFLVATELFGNGRSSSPSNTPEPFHGPRFPVMTIRDNVEAVHRLLTEELKITHLRAVVGFSMGAQQAFQWAVSYPEFVDRVVATSGTAKTYPHGVVRLEGQIAALTADAAFQDGDYTDSARKRPGGVRNGVGRLALFAGMVAPGIVAHRPRPGDHLRTDARSIPQALHRADANDLILQVRTWERHDVGTTPGFGGDMERALRSIKVPLLYMPSETDLYFPVGDARYEAAFIPGVKLMPIPSLWGHTAGAASNPADAKFLNENIGSFLAGGK